MKKYLEERLKYIWLTTEKKKGIIGVAKICVGILRNTQHILGNHIVIDS